MSVTFTIEALPTGAFTAECYDRGITLHGKDYDAILLVIALHKKVCEECQHYGIYPQAVLDVDGGEVNLSNTNAVEVLRTLGLDVDPTDLVGGATADEFYAAVTLAQIALQDDSGVPAADLTTPGSARFVDCGRRPGYMTERLGQLADLAARAQHLGRDVQWA